MDPRLLELIARRERLIARAEAQRGNLARQIEPWKVPATAIDRGRAGIRFLKSHPLLMAGIAAFLVAARPRAALKWAKRGWLLWQVISGLRSRLRDRSLLLPF